MKWYAIKSTQKSKSFYIQPMKEMRENSFKIPLNYCVSRNRNKGEKSTW